MENTDDSLLNESGREDDFILPSQSQTTGWGGGHAEFRQAIDSSNLPRSEYFNDENSSGYSGTTVGGTFPSQTILAENSFSEDLPKATSGQAIINETMSQIPMSQTQMPENTGIDFSCNENIPQGNGVINESATQIAPELQGNGNVVYSEDLFSPTQLYTPVLDDMSILDLIPGTPAPNATDGPVNNDVQFPTFPDAIGEDLASTPSPEIAEDPVASILRSDQLVKSGENRVDCSTAFKCADTQPVDSTVVINDSEDTVSSTKPNENVSGKTFAIPLQSEAKFGIEDGQSLPASPKDNNVGEKPSKDPYAQPLQSEAMFESEDVNNLPPLPKDGEDVEKSSEEAFAQPAPLGNEVFKVPKDGDVVEKPSEEPFAQPLQSEALFDSEVVNSLPVPPQDGDTAEKPFKEPVAQSLQSEEIFETEDVNDSPAPLKGGEAVAQPLESEAALFPSEDIVKSLPFCSADISVEATDAVDAGDTKKPAGNSGKDVEESTGDVHLETKDVAQEPTKKTDDSKHESHGHKDLEDSIGDAFKVPLAHSSGAGATDLQVPEDKPVNGSGGNQKDGEPAKIDTSDCELPDTQPPQSHEGTPSSKIDSTNNSSRNGTDPSTATPPDLISVSCSVVLEISIKGFIRPDTKEVIKGKITDVRSIPSDDGYLAASEASSTSASSANSHTHNLPYPLPRRTSILRTSSGSTCSPERGTQQEPVDLGSLSPSPRNDEPWENGHLMHRELSKALMTHSLKENREIARLRKFTHVLPRLSMPLTPEMEPIAEISTQTDEKIQQDAATDVQSDLSPKSKEREMKKLFEATGFVTDAVNFEFKNETLETPKTPRVRRPRKPVKKTPAKTPVQSPDSDSKEAKLSPATSEADTKELKKSVKRKPKKLAQGMETNESNKSPDKETTPQKSGESEGASTGSRKRPSPVVIDSVATPAKRGRGRKNTPMKRIVDESQEGKDPVLSKDEAYDNNQTVFKATPLSKVKERQRKVSTPKSDQSGISDALEETDSGSDAKVASVSKKGRPRKVKPETSATSDTADSDEPKPGNTDSDQSKVLAEGTDSKATPVSKLKGRPRKVSTPTAETSVNLADFGSNQSKATPLSKVKGRPRKFNTPKSVAPVDDATDTGTDQSNALVEDTGSKATPLSKVKRLRKVSTPKAAKLLASDTVNSEDSEKVESSLPESNTTVKVTDSKATPLSKARGRPKKVNTPTSEEYIDNQMVTGSNITPFKAVRGRKVDTPRPKMSISASGDARRHSPLLKARGRPPKKDVTPKTSEASEVIEEETKGEQVPARGTSSKKTRGRKEERSTDTDEKMTSGRKRTVASKLKITEDGVKAIDDATPPKRSKGRGSSTKESESSSGESSRKMSEAKQFVSGLRVFAKWSDHCFYSGVLSKEASSGKWAVKFDDGSVKQIVESHLIPLAAIQEGHAVDVVQNNAYTPGLVISIKGEGNYTVDTGKSEVQVVPINMRLNKEQVTAIRVDGGSALIGTPTSLQKSTVDPDNIVSGKRRARATDPGPFVITSSKGKSKAPVIVNVTTEALEFTPCLDIDTCVNSAPMTPAGKSGPGGPTPKSRRKILKDPVLDDLGPIPEEGSTVFDKMSFLFNYVKAKGRRVSPKKKGSYSDASMSEAEDKNFFDALEKIPFNEGHLRQQILAGGGKIYEKFEDIPSTEYSSTRLVTNRPNHSARFLLCLAHGIEAVHYTHIILAVKRGEGFRRMKLDYVGWSLTESRWLEKPRNISKTFQGRDVFIYSKSLDTEADALFLKFWTIVMEKAGAQVHGETDLNYANTIVTDSSIPPDLMETINALGDAAPEVVSTRWVIQSLLSGRALSATGHQSFHHGYSSTSS